MVFDSLDTWFEKGFRIRKQRPVTIYGDKIRSGNGRRYVPVNGVKFSSGAKAKNIRAIVKRAPEVLVKITGHSSGRNTVRHHLDYISRNGAVDLENERGEIIQGRGGVSGLLDELKAAQIPNDSKRREFLHVLFSMPAGTPEQEFKKSLREFCQEEFATRQYVMALHRDTDHMHAHVCVSTRDMARANEPRLSPRKADLFRWRLGFADKLRENGIDAAASERRHRFQYRRAENPVVRQIRADNPDSPVYNARRAERLAEARIKRTKANPEGVFIGPPPRIPNVYKNLAAEIEAALASNRRPENPAQHAIEKNIQRARQGWETLAAAMEKHGDGLANEVRALLRTADRPVTSHTQELFDKAQAHRELGKGQGGEVELN
ncbi:MAG: relaxase/mobilization nuclease domain-containing protein [Azoarcus sp.]|jgi:hypothetical protein|nr:relaxase/mobilization nuclease domain-containing protein [Azoarcus sp.]